MSWRMAAALLFDLDGTLLHSDPLHVAVFVEMFARRGKVIDSSDYLRLIHGRSNAEVFTQNFPGEDAAALADAKEAAFRARLGSTAPATPGLVDLLAFATANDIPCAVVTNAPRENAVAMLSAIGLADRFPVVVASGDTAEAKPHPAPYRLALRRLGADAGKSLAFEDSPSGIAAAVAAGLTTVGIRSSLSDARLRQAGASITLEDFTDPALPALLARLQGADA